MMDTEQTMQSNSLGSGSIVRGHAWSYNIVCVDVVCPCHYNLSRRKSQTQI
jgi:hypothetical protein